MRLPKLTGALLIDKPEGITSHDVVARVRKLADDRRCGHTGTLDPFATGLLVLCLGRATRLARFLSESGKAYVATVRFGFATTTYDRTGMPLGEPTEACPDLETLERALQGFVGPQEQRPPPFSAKKVNGKRAHRLARAGVPVDPLPVRVEVGEIRLLDWTPPRARIYARVTSGTYIRSLAHDLGERLSCGAHLDELRRTGVGSFDIGEASTLEELEGLAAERRLSDRLVPPREMLRDLPDASLSGEAAERFLHGRDVVVEEAPQTGFVRIRGERGELLGVGERRPLLDTLRPVVVWASPSEREAQGS